MRMAGEFPRIRRSTMAGIAAAEVLDSFSAGCLLAAIATDECRLAMIAKYEDPWAEHRRLLALVLRQPDRDEPRLQLANWLGRTGRDSEMAEFIRVDIAYWRAITDYSPSGESAEHIAALKEKRDLRLDGHVKRWREPLYKVIGERRGITFRTHRGLITSIIAAGVEAAQRVILRADDLLALAPIESLCLEDSPEYDESSSASGNLTIKALMRTRLFRALKSLELTGNWIGEAGGAALLEAIPPPRLLFVTLPNSDIGYCMEQRLRQWHPKCWVSFDCKIS